MTNENSKSNPILKVSIDTNKRSGTIIFLVVWVFLVLNYFPKDNVNHSIQYIFIIVSILISFYLLWMLVGSVLVIVTNDQLIVENRISNIKYWSKKFRIDNIENIYEEVNSQANTSWGFGKISFGTNFLSPLFRIYDKNPTAIVFTYLNKNKKIGEGLAAFDAHKIITEIKKVKKKT